MMQSYWIENSKGIYLGKVIGSQGIKCPELIFGLLRSHV